MRAALGQIKWAVATSSMGIVLFAAVRLWHVEGLLLPVTIDGPSMAPALCGARWAVTCGDCRFPFWCDAQHVPSDDRAACPNCGFAENRLSGAHGLPPQQVLIDRWPLLWRRPSRGELVALRTASDELAVKRIAGLPGEHLAIRDGDLYAGSKLIRKSAAELRSMRLLVHDNDFQPQQTYGLSSRWQAPGAASRWKPTGTGFAIDASGGGSAVDWLQYVHWAGTAQARLRGVATPITDNDSYNQGETRRPLNGIHDVIVSCRIRTGGKGQLWFAAVDGQQRFELEIEPPSRAILRRQAEVLLDRELSLSFSRPSDFEFGLCDQQVFLLVNGRVAMRYAYERAAGPPAETLHPLAIGVRGLEAQVDRLRVWRDIYCLDPRGLDRHWQLDAPLEANHFAVLGDNQPVSIDSRHWEPAGVARGAIRGRVYPAFWPRRQTATSKATAPKPTAAWSPAQGRAAEPLQRSDRARANKVPANAGICPVDLSTRRSQHSSIPALVDPNTRSLRCLP